MYVALNNYRAGTIVPEQLSVPYDESCLFLARDSIYAERAMLRQFVVACFKLLV